MFVITPLKYLFDYNIIFLHTYNVLTYLADAGSPAAVVAMASASASTASSPIFEWHHYNMLLPALANLRPTSSSCNEPSSLLEPQANRSAVNTEAADVPKWKRHLHLSKDVFAADSSSDEEQDLEEQKEEGKDVSSMMRIYYINPESQKCYNLRHY